MRRSTFYEEDLGKVVDLCGHGTWANADLCEIIQELVDALSPLQTMSKGHEESFVALEAVQKTAQEQASGETSSVHQLRMVWMSLSRDPAAAGQFTVQNDGSGILTGSHCLVCV